MVTFEMFVANLLQTQFHRNAVDRAIFINHQQRPLLFAVVHRQSEPTVLPILLVHHAPFAIVIETKIGHSVHPVVIFPTIHHIRANERSMRCFDSGKRVEWSGGSVGKLW